jgi:hypothetical protein
MKNHLKTRCGTLLSLATLAWLASPWPVAAGSWSASTVSGLIAAINKANQIGGVNTITLAPGVTFTLSAVNNTADGATGLPVIAAGNNLTIIGNGATIARNTADSQPEFRLVNVAPGASLTLVNLTLQGGLAHGPGVWAQGGAILNQGTLTLSAVTVQDNTAEGRYGDSPPDSGAGGGIFSCGSVTLDDGTLITDNSAYGSWGGVVAPRPGYSYGLPGGNGLGGGLCVAAGSARLNRVTLYFNVAQGGHGGGSSGAGGSGFGGALYVADGTVALTNVVMSANVAIGNTGGSAGTGAGGAVCVARGTVTVVGALLSSNAASGADGIYSTASSSGTAGGSACGGGLYVADGTVALIGDTLSSNVAAGGDGGIGPKKSGAGGNGFGGGLYAAAGTVALSNDSVTANLAVGGASGKGGRAGVSEGGGVYINSAVSSSFDAATVIFGNKPDDCFGCP